MNNENEGFYTTKEQRDHDELNNVVDKLEMLLKEIKDKAAEEGGEAKRDIARVVRENVDRTKEALRRARKQARVGMDKTTDAYKHVKEKYDSIDSDKQKMIKLTLVSTLISAIMAFVVTVCFGRKGNDK